MILLGLVGCCAVLLCLVTALWIFLICYICMVGVVLCWLLLGFGVVYLCGVDIWWFGVFVDVLRMIACWLLYDAGMLLCAMGFALYFIVQF